MQVELWYSLDPQRITKSRIDSAELRQQLSGLLTRRHGVGATEVRLDSELGLVLQSVLAEQATTFSLLALFTVALLFMGVALIVLSAALLRHRHHTTLELLHARGFSDRQRRRLLGISGLVIALPAALIGQMIALWVLPGAVPLWMLAVGLAVVAVCVLTLISFGEPHGGRVTVRPRGRRRLLGEAVVLLVTAISVWLLVTRTPDANGSGLDPLPVAAPALLAASGAIVVLRVIPYPLRWLAAPLRQRRGFSALLGVVRSLRSPTGGPLPVAVLALGSSLAVTGITLQSTIANGVTDAAWSKNGAAVRLSGPRISDTVFQALAEIDGVASVTRLNSQGGTSLDTPDGESQRVDLWLADSTLLDVWLTSPLSPDVPPALFSSSAPASIVVGGIPDQNSDVAVLEGLGEVSLAAIWDELPGFATGGVWALADVSDYPSASVTPATVALLNVAAGSDVDVVAAAVADVVETGIVTTVEDRLEEARDSPTVSWLSTVAVAITGFALLFMACGLIIAQALGARDRSAAHSLLRTLGMSRREVRNLTACEMVPLILVAVIPGGVLGVGIAAFLIRTIDLMIVTGGSVQPRLYVDPILAGGIFAVVLATLVTVMVAATRIAPEAGRAAQREGGH